MPRPRKFKRPVGKDSKSHPAIRIVFKGSQQADYFAILKAAEDEETNQTDLARRILTDWVKLRGWKKPTRKGQGLKCLEAS